MKLHSGWIAGAMLFCIIFACDLSNKNSNNSNNSNSNSNKNRNENVSSAPATNRPANADVYVEKIYMAKDNDGEPGDETSSYEPSDHKVHCLIDLNKAKKGTKVRFVWKAVDVEGEKNKEIKSTDYTTNSFENKVHGHLQLPYDWPKGTYRVEVYINDNLDKTIDYTVG
jgi:hypothetical protein